MKDDYEFPFEKLPAFGMFPLPIFQAAVNEVIRAERVPPKLALYSAVAAACSLAQMHADVRTAAGIVSTGLFVMLQGKSGERKTQVDRDLYGEFRKEIPSHQDQYRREFAVYKVNDRLWKRINKKLNDQLHRDREDGKNTSEIEAEIAKHELGEPQEPNEIKLVVNDITIAALKSLLSHSPNVTLLTSDGKKAMTLLLLPNDSDFNQLWSGESNRVDRKTTKSYKLDGVRFTFLVMIQPEVLGSIMLDKGRNGMESGFFSRVIFSDVGSTQGTRMIEVIEPPKANLDTYNQRVAQLKQKYFDAVSSGTYRRETLEFDPDAWRTWIAYFNYVESNNAVGGRYERAGDHAAKLAENVARVAAGLHVLEGFEGDIGMDCLLCAIALCDEASKDYMHYLAPKNQDAVEAMALKEWLVEKYVRKRCNWVDQNTITKYAPNRMRSARLLQQYLEILERDKYLIIWPGGANGRTRATVQLLMNGQGEAVTPSEIGIFEWARSLRDRGN